MSERASNEPPISSNSWSVARPFTADEMIKPGTVASKILAFNERQDRGSFPYNHTPTLHQSDDKLRQLNWALRNNQLLLNSSGKSSVTRSPKDNGLPLQGARMEPGTRSGFGKRQGGGWAPPAGRRTSARNSPVLSTTRALAIGVVQPAKGLPTTSAARSLSTARNSITPLEDPEGPAVVNGGTSKKVATRETEFRPVVDNQVLDVAAIELSPTRPSRLALTGRVKASASSRSHSASSPERYSRKISARLDSPIRHQTSPSSVITKDSNRYAKKTSFLGRRASLPEVLADNHRSNASQKLPNSRGSLSSRSVSVGERPVPRQSAEGSLARLLESSKHEAPSGSPSNRVGYQRRSGKMLDGPMFWSPQSYQSETPELHMLRQMSTFDNHWELGHNVLDWTDPPGRQRFSFESAYEERLSPKESEEEGLSPRLSKAESLSQASLRALLSRRTSKDPVGMTKGTHVIVKKASSGLRGLLPRLFTWVEQVSDAENPNSQPDRQPSFSTADDVAEDDERDVSLRQSANTSTVLLSPSSLPAPPSRSSGTRQGKHDEKRTNQSTGAQRKQQLGSELVDHASDNLLRLSSLPAPSNTLKLNDSVRSRSAPDTKDGNSAAASATLEANHTQHVIFETVATIQGPSVPTGCDLANYHHHPRQSIGDVSCSTSTSSRRCQQGDIVIKRLRVMLNRDEQVDVKMTIQVQPRSVNNSHRQSTSNTFFTASTQIGDRSPQEE